MNLGRETQFQIMVFITISILFGTTIIPILAGPTSNSKYEYKLQWENADPYFIDVDESGNVYVAGRNSNSIQKYNSDGTLLATWGGPGIGQGQFNDPEGIAVDNNNGLVYVTDSENNRVQRFDLDGNFLGIAGSYGSGAGQFINPSGIAVDEDSNVYVVDRENSRIQKFHSDGTFILMWGSYGTGDVQFHSPESIAVDQLGFVYVGDEENNRVQKFDSNGNFISTLANIGSAEGFVIDPEDVAVDTHNNVYIADSDNSRIQRFNVDGTLTDVWGGQGSENGKFNDPRGVAVDTLGNVYVADTGNRRIQKFSPTTGTIIASITDERGTPLSTADIISTNQPEGQSALSGVTDENGIAEFRGVRPGAYQLEASVNGRVIGTQSADVSAGQESRTIIQQVIMSNLTVTVVDSSDTLIQGAVVSMITAPDGQQPLIQTSGSDGKVVFNEILLGGYVIQASKGGITVEGDVDVQGGVENNLQLKIAQEDTTKGGLKVTVRTSGSGEPIQGVSIEMRVVPSGQDKIELVTDSNGIAETNNLVTGDYYLVATKPGYETTSYDGPTIKANMVEEITIFIPKITLVKFVITEISSPQYINMPFTITIQAQDEDGNLFTPYHGINTLSASVGAINPATTGEFNEGEWTGLISLSEIGYIILQTTGDSISYKSNQITVLSSTEQKMGTLEVAVKNEFENTMGGAVVFCKPLNVVEDIGVNALTSVADISGVATFRELLPLSYNVTAYKENYLSSSYSIITLQPDTTSKITIILKNPRPGSLPENSEVPGFNPEIIIVGSILGVFLLSYIHMRHKPEDNHG